MPTPNAETALRDLYGKVVSLNKLVMELTLIAMRDPSSDASAKRDAVLQELSTLMPVLSNAEKSVSPDELKSIQGKLRQEGVLPQ